MFKRTSHTDAEIVEINRACYDTLGEDYTDGAGDLETIIATGEWQKFIDSMPGKKVLNVGCGLGDASAWLDEHGYDVTSTDIAPEMVKATARKCPKSRNLTLGANELDSFGDERFDGILAIHLIQHLSKTLLGGTTGFFKQVCDHLTDDGIFLLVFTNNCYPVTGYQPEGSVDGLYTFWHKYNLEDIVPLLNQAKLKPVSYRAQKVVEASCGNVEPFILICQKA